jgi:hypothetical protein
MRSYGSEVLTFISCGISVQGLGTNLTVADNSFDGNIANLASGGGVAISAVDGGWFHAVNITRNVFRDNQVLFQGLWSLPNLVGLWH